MAGSKIALFVLSWFIVSTKSRRKDTILPNPSYQIHPKSWKLVFLRPKNASSYCPPLPKEDDNFLLFPSNFPSSFPPSINFIRSNPTSSSRRERRKKFSHLKFVYRPIPTLEQVILSSGFSFCHLNETEDWVGYLNAQYKIRTEIHSPYQINKKKGRKHSVMAGSEILDEKIPFLKKYRTYQKKFGWDFHLPAFILPDEREQFLKDFEKRKKKFIYKPSKGWFSRGVFLLGNLSHLQEIENEEAILQTYLKDVFLFEGAKIEPRFHVLMTSANPLRIYLWDEGFVKLFDNYEKTMKQFKETDNISGEGVRGYLNYVMPLTLTLQKMKEKGVDTNKFMEQAKDIIIKTMIMGENDLAREALKFPRGNSFQYFSVDFMWDRKMKPYLIEINRYPALTLGDQFPILSELLMDLLNVVGFPYKTCWKKKQYLGKTKRVRNCSLELQDILGVNNITKQDLQTLMESEDELYRMKWTRFNRIFPERNTFKYLEFLEGDLSPYILQQRWEQAFYSRREEGINLLRCFIEEYF